MIVFYFFPPRHSTHVSHESLGKLLECYDLDELVVRVVYRRIEYKVRPGMIIQSFTLYDHNKSLSIVHDDCFIELFMDFRDEEFRRQPFFYYYKLTMKLIKSKIYYTYGRSLNLLNFYFVHFLFFACSAIYFTVLTIQLESWWRYFSW